MTAQKPETGFLDRLGGRFLVRGRAGDYVEILVFRDELVSASGFEAAVRGAVARLADFRHPTVRRVRGVARLAAPDNRLALVSEASPGRRLSEILLAAERDNRFIDTRGALHIVRELLTAMNAMHEASGGVSHGALGPERIVIAPDGRILVTEHVLGSALECHSASATQEHFWRDFRLALVEDGDAVRFGERTDVLQIGIVAMSLVLGRLLRREEFPRRMGELLLGATETGPSGSRITLGLGLRAWLVRALHLGSQDAYSTVGQALKGLDQLLAGDDGYVADADAVFAMLSPPPQAESVAASAGSRDSGSHDAAVPAEPSRYDEQQPPPVAVAARGTDDAPVQVAVGAAAEPAGTRAQEETAAVPVAPAAAAEPASVESLSTPAGVACIAADVRPAGAQTPKSGGFRVQSRPGASGKSDSGRFSVGEARLVQTPQPPAPMLFGAVEPDETERRASARRRWIIMGAAAAGLILVVAGVPALWLMSRPSAPEAATNPTVVASRPGGSETGADANAQNEPPVVPAEAPGQRAQAIDAAKAPPVSTPPAAANAKPAPAATPPSAPPPVTEGLLTVSAPLPMQILEKGAQVGSSPGGPVSLTAGRHDIELVNESIGYRDTRSVNIVAGKTLPIVVNFPPGNVSINAVPWAEVWVDGQRVGETPVGNVALPVGPHEVLFRHPQLGERRQTIVVTVTGPLRVSADLRKQQ